METNKKTDWQWFLVINSWCLHLSLRAHINYIVAMWTFKRSDVINLFRVTMGSTDHKDFTPVACRSVATFAGYILQVPAAALGCCQREGGLWTGQPQLHIPEGQLSFSLHWDSKLRTLFHSRWRYECHTQIRAQPEHLSWKPWCNCSSGCSNLPFPDHNSLHSRPWKADKKTPPLLLP